jgi:hypothetical protein
MQYNKTIRMRRQPVCKARIACHELFGRDLHRGRNIALAVATLHCFGTDRLYTVGAFAVAIR